MTKLDKLKKEARQSATRRGHKLCPFNELSEGTVYAFCETCGKEVFVKEHPFPNEVDIDGEAVALNCN